MAVNEEQTQPVQLAVDTAFRQLGGAQGDVAATGAQGRRRLRVVDSEGGAASAGVVAFTEVPLASGYELQARMTLAAPRSGSTDCSVELLFDAADADTCYLFRFRELSGVRHCTMARRVSGGEETLADMVVAYSFATPLDVRVVVDGARIEVWVDGGVVGAANDVRRLRHDAVGVAARNTAVEVERVAVTVLHDDPLPARGLVVDDVGGRELVEHVEQLSVGNDSYRLDLGTARWTDGETVTASLWTKDGGEWIRVTAPVEAGADGAVREVYVGDWYLLSGDHGSRNDLRASTSGRRLRFTWVQPVDEHTVVLRAEVPGYQSVSLTWSFAGAVPRVTATFVPDVTGHHVLLYHGFASRQECDVTEVMCGPLQHGRRIRDAELVGAAELPAPMCLVEHAPGASRARRTWGLVMPADAHSFGDEVVKDPEDQPYGMSLRGADGAVQPTVALPQYGRRAFLRAGESTTVEVGLCARADELYPTYRELLRTEYDYRPYRENVFGVSLTDTMYNLVDLLAAAPVEDDSVDYQGSPSGWWSRAKGFIDIENDQAVRATTTAVLLSAAYLTADMRLYEERARPVIEYQLSRNAYGWTPKHGYSVYAHTDRAELCATPVGVTALGALHAMTRRQNPAIAELAEQDIGADEDYWLRRAPMCAPLAAYRVTGDPAYLEQARQRADTYVDERVDTAQTGWLHAHDFAIYYCADWIGLLEMFEETGQRNYLDAALREARRFVAEVFVRPIHEGSVVVPDRPLFHDRQIELSRWWDPDALYDYPRTEVEPEQVSRWLLSITGQSFEALQTYRYSGPNQNPGWAPHLLRLGYHVGDTLLVDIAHNAVTGRFTNYPGYYFRQHTAHHMKPDFPFTGPFDNTTIYYHHAPGQLGMTIDYLVTEHETRSTGRIRFPAEFEENFVWFRFRTFGHRPGSFYGDEGVWLWMPRGVVSLDTGKVNWLAGKRSTEQGDDRFYLSLTNSSSDPVQVGVTFGPLLGIEATSTRTVTVLADGVGREETVHGDRLTVPVSGHGITALVVPVSELPDVPTHREPQAVTSALDSYRFDEASPTGAVRGMLLARPDGSGDDAFVQSRCRTPAVLHYSFDDGVSWHRVDKSVHPAEWTVRVPLGAGTFSYLVEDADGVRSTSARLRR